MEKLGGSVLAATMAGRLLHRGDLPMSKKKDPEWKVRWSNNVVDMHRVFRMVQSLYLQLEGNNEAMLRVGVELVTSKADRKVLGWSEDWYDHDDKRSWFKERLQLKLQKVLEVAEFGGAKEKAEGKDEKALKQQLAANEAAQAALSEARDKIRLLTLQIEGGDVDDMQQRIAELEDAASKNQAQMLLMRREAEQQAQLLAEAQAEAAPPGPKLREALDELKELKKRLAEEQAKNDAKLITAPVSPPTRSQINLSDGPAEVAAKVAAAQTALQKDSEEVAQRLRETEAALASLRKQVEALGFSKAELSKISEDLAAGRIPRGTQTDKEAARKKEKRECTSFSATQTDDFFGAATPRDESEELLQLREDNQRMKVALEELQLKLKHLMNTCRVEGNDISHIVDIVGLDCIVKAASVWDRLYNDAMERIKRVRDQEEAREVMEMLMPGVDVMQQLRQSNILSQPLEVAVLNYPPEAESRPAPQPILLQLPESALSPAGHSWPEEPPLQVKPLFHSPAAASSSPYCASPQRPSPSLALAAAPPSPHFAPTPRLSPKHQGSASRAASASSSADALPSFTLATSSVALGFRDDNDGGPCLVTRKLITTGNVPDGPAPCGREESDDCLAEQPQQGAPDRGCTGQLLNRRAAPPVLSLGEVEGPLSPALDKGTRSSRQPPRQPPSLRAHHREPSGTRAPQANMPLESMFGFVAAENEKHRARQRDTREALAIRAEKPQPPEKPLPRPPPQMKASMSLPELSSAASSSHVDAVAAANMMHQVVGGPARRRAVVIG